MEAFFQVRREWIADGAGSLQVATGESTRPRAHYVIFLDDEPYMRLWARRQNGG
ncbi:hypothetical protein [Actinomyces qiguomingii]|uniref:hypothetical protein n=1 Tax=Actinomyces qiguomingii TaxID=2057800 RepID=UPI001304A544|nr:hypothetical protein [Actinomyces qiguomingii]